ncbi:PAS domain S-box protein [Panacibacter sp. DH6]|uniref:histidine kinase n=1 Tax=Panacibacter microcysteis TaxID=2793269 RepID=A0A931EAY5_9BACT|nr:PAS domain S-box protein [Panacibacter microcysteis]MBG9377619.1 PAS domain S-box protein [Panacibacter microcysteis]
MIPNWLKHSKTNLVLLFDSNGNVREYNDALAKAFCVSGKLLFTSEIFTGTEFEEFQHLSNVVLNDSFAHIEFISHDPQSNLYTWEFTLFTENIIIGIAQQNSVTKRTQSIIKESHLIDSFMNNSPASAWICDAAGRLLNMNRYYLAFTGLSINDIGKSLWDIFPQHLADLYQLNNNIVLTTQKVLKTEEISIDLKGRTRNFLVYKFPLTTIDHNKLVGGWAIDITELKAAEQKVYEHDLKIKELAFLQSHEVRRPLANMLGLLELIRTDVSNVIEPSLKDMLLYIQLSATELDNEIKRVIDRLQA